MEKRPPNQRATREEAAQNEARYQPPRGRQPYGQRQPYSPYRQEPPDPLEEVLGKFATLQQAIDGLAGNMLGKDEILTLVRETGADFKRQLADYYPRDIMDAKLAERSEIVQTVRSEIASLRSKIEHPQDMAHAFIRGFWSTWQARAVLVSCLILAGIFSGVILIDVATLLLRK